MQGGRLTEGVTGRAGLGEKTAEGEEPARIVVHPKRGEGSMGVLARGATHSKLGLGQSSLLACVGTPSESLHTGRPTGTSKKVR